MYDPRSPQVNRFCTVKPMCHFKPHHPMTQAKKDTMKRDMTMIAMACPTERPWVRKVLGVCHVAILRAPLNVWARHRLVHRPIQTGSEGERRTAMSRRRS